MVSTAFSVAGRDDAHFLVGLILRVLLFLKRFDLETVHSSGFRLMLVGQKFKRRTEAHYRTRRLILVAETGSLKATLIVWIRNRGQTA